MSEAVMRIENVSKKYSKSLKRAMFYGLSDISRNMLGLSSRSDRLRKDEFWAVDDVSFEIKKGETLGLVGANGSGKTTMLKMLNGIFWPDRGRITVKGRVGALIAVGAGFHPLLTGRENIFVNGAILGMNQAEMRKKVDKIVDFAGIGDFLDTPVKNYSSGMFVRLGFAVAIHCEPDILLIDEVLSVGDVQFQAKCIYKMKELGKKGTTMIYVSHNMNSVFLMCQNCVYFSKGKMLHYGSTREILNEYKKDMLRGSGADGFVRGEMRYGTGEVQITEVKFLDQNDRERTCFKRGEFFQIKITYEARENIDNAEFAIAIYAQDGTMITKPTTRDHKIPLENVNGKGELRYCIRSMPLNIGQYKVTVGSWDYSGFIAYDTHESMYEFMVEDGDIDGRIHERGGLVYLPAEWIVKQHG